MCVLTVLPHQISHNTLVELTLNACNVRQLCFGRGTKGEKEYDDKADRRDARTTAFGGEGRQNTDGDLVLTSRASDSCHLD